jgi:hypothetical protein
MRCCPTTKDYVARRRAEGKSSREIQRCLKRYIARELYRAQRQHYAHCLDVGGCGGRLTNIEASEGWTPDERGFPVCCGSRTTDRGVRVDHGWRGRSQAAIAPETRRHPRFR